jgi:hypothetical protein
MPELFLLILNALLTCISASIPHTLSDGVISYHPNHCALIAIQSLFLDMVLLPVAILTNTGAKLTNQQSLIFANKSSAATPTFFDSDITMSQPQELRINSEGENMNQWLPPCFDKRRRLQ